MSSSCATVRSVTVLAFFCGGVGLCDIEFDGELAREATGDRGDSASGCGEGGCNAEGVDPLDGGASSC